MKEKKAEKRPWGRYTVLKSAENYKVKSIIVKPHQKLSLQLHERRAEHWICVRGKMLVTVGDKKIHLTPGEHVFIPKKAKHRMENTGDALAEIIEVQTGDYLGEDDIKRLEDIYGRA